MAKNNRSRKRHGEYEPLDMSKIAGSMRKTEVKRGRSWTVQNISSVNAQKVYICPGCHLEILPGTAHLVAWRNDGLMGEAADLEERRHWHETCWKVS